MLISGMFLNLIRFLCRWLKIMIVLLIEKFSVVSSVVMVVRLNFSWNSENSLMVSSMLCMIDMIVFSVNCYLNCS